MGKLTERWDTQSTTIDSIWPATIPGDGTTITTTYVLIKGLPPDPNNNPQFAAFVVWNSGQASETVGHIWRVRRGAPTGPDFNTKMNNAFMTVGAAHSNFAWGQNGNVGSPPPPRGGPNGDGEYTISINELNNSKGAGQDIDTSVQGFMGFTP